MFSAEVYTYSVKHIQVLLRAYIDGSVLLDRLLNDFMLGLPAFADCFHFSLHLQKSVSLLPNVCGCTYLLT